MLPAPVDALQPITTDTRVKTLIYNENDVFKLTTYFGYQSNIEFAHGERVQTISIGNKTSWQLVPSGRRLFVRPLTKRNRTNMTVITNKRAYQFDLHSKPATNIPKPELTYVVRFFYPSEETTIANEPFAKPRSVEQDLAIQGARLNYRYTFSGNPRLAPLKIFDDSRKTYFKFNPRFPTPSIGVVRNDGNEYPAYAAVQGEYVVLRGLHRRFSLKYGNESVQVFNEGLR